MCLYDIPYGDTTHLINPLNEHRPIKISRDGQELPRDIGVSTAAPEPKTIYYRGTHTSYDESSKPPQKRVFKKKQLFQPKMSFK